MKFRLFLLAILASAFAFAQETMPLKFQATAFLVKGKDFYDTWHKADAQTPPTITEAKRGDDLYLPVLFTGARADRNGNVKVTYSLTMTKPDGKKLVAPEVKGRDEKLSEEVRKSLVIVSTRIPIKLTDQDPVGKYKFEIKVKDHNATDAFEAEVPVTFEVDFK